MANEIRTAQTTGQNLYLHVRKASDITYYLTSTLSLESYNVAHWANYAIALSEIGSTGEYYASFPTAITGAGVYDVILYARAGGSAASTDTKLGGASMVWDGSTELTLVGLDNEIDAIGVGNVTIRSTSPVSQDLSITIFRGDDYYAADNRALDWTTSDSSTWPTLTGATPITFTASQTVANAQETTGGAASITHVGSVVTATGANKQVRVELDAATTATLSVGKHAYAYDVQATLSNGHKVTLASGTMTVREDYTTS